MACFTNCATSSTGAEGSVTRTAGVFASSTTGASSLATS
ncbi:Uncharacterised protein [Bordetella pertussis]|nr:Uncharacterised protein [Bordetella pertussis]